MAAHHFSLLLTGWLLRDVCHCFVGVFFDISLIILELRASFTVRRHILVFLLFLLLLTGVMRKEKGGKRGRKKMDDREKEWRYGGKKCGKK